MCVRERERERVFQRATVVRCVCVCVCVCVRARTSCVCTCCVRTCVMCNVYEERAPPPLLRDRGDDICVIVCGVRDNINLKKYTGNQIIKYGCELHVLEVYSNSLQSS